MRKRLIITLARESGTKTFRFSIDIESVVLATVLLIVATTLFVFSASWGARQIVGELLRQNSALRLENANYRDATTELAAQVSVLQAATDELGTRAAVDPDAARAMNRLPSSITHRAMGGGTAVEEVTAPLTSMMSSAEPAFGVLSDVLSMIGRKLDEARPGVERREALASATPSIWPVAGWLSSPYGNRRDPFTGSADFHPGLDISAGTGEAVRATADGVVVTARQSGDYGNLVAIDHGFGIGTRYGHLLRTAVFEGQRIRRGDVVGFVGSTGRSTSPHVHYEVTLNGRPSNPLRLLGR